MKLRSNLLALALLAVLPVAAHAQACLGTPSQPGSAMVFGGMDMPTDMAVYTVGAGMDFKAPVSLHAALHVWKPDAGDSQNSYSVGGAYRLMEPDGPSQLALCPVANVEYMSTDGMTAYTVPLGVSLGTQLSLDQQRGISVLPFVAPQLVYSHASFDVLGTNVSDSSTDFAIEGGANVAFQKFFAGVRVQRLFVDGAETVLGLQLGVVF